MALTGSELSPSSREAMFFYGVQCEQETILRCEKMGCNTQAILRRWDGPVAAARSRIRLRNSLVRTSLHISNRLRELFQCTIPTSSDLRSHFPLKVSTRT